MAKNDTILLDGIIDDRIEAKIPSDRRDEVFEFFAFEQVLKNFDLSLEEIDYGWIDGKADGGIDGFYIFVNGRILKELDVFLWPKKNAELNIVLVTCKHHDTFRQAPLDNLMASISEIFDFTIPNSSLKGSYSEEVVHFRNLFLVAYKKLSTILDKMSIHFTYASRGDASSVGESIIARSEQIKDKTSKLFSSCDVQFCFMGATELINSHRKVRSFSLELPFVESIAQAGSNVVLANLQDYYNFISDDSKKLRRYLFEANVRDFLGLNSVNEDIANSLIESTADFWWLNNGITILATSTKVVGKIIQMEDVQIVNGLQTTESIFRYFSSGGKDLVNRSVLIKVITSGDADIRDKIIRATNNQSQVELSSLHATDKIQRDIEDILARNEWYYERRKNHYRLAGKSISQIVSPLYVAAAAVTFILKNPEQAVGIKGRHLRDVEAYEQIFSSNVPLEVWPKIISVLKKVEQFLEMRRPDRGGHERFLLTWRNLTSFLIVSRFLGKFTYSNQELIEFDVERITQDAVIETWDIINTIKSEVRHYSPKNREYVQRCCREFAQKFNISGEQVVSSNRLPLRKRHKEIVSDEIIAIVDKHLPDQPWKPRTHQELAIKLNLSTSKVYAAISALVDAGKWNRQVDGVVYDADDNVIAIDKERQSGIFK